MTKPFESAEEKIEDKFNEQFEEYGLVLKNVEGVKGYWRQQDVWRWEGWVHRQREGFRDKAFVGSWFTLTECLNAPALVFNGEDISPVKSKDDGGLIDYVGATNFPPKILDGL